MSSLSPESPYLGVQYDTAPAGTFKQSIDQNSGAHLGLQGAPTAPAGAEALGIGPGGG